MGECGSTPLPTEPGEPGVQLVPHGIEEARTEGVAGTDGVDDVDRVSVDENLVRGAPAPRPASTSGTSGHHHVAGTDRS